MAQPILSIIHVYLWIGAVVALVLVSCLGRIDPAAQGTYGFRLLIVPGAVILWPLAIWRALCAIRRPRTGGTP